LSTRIGGDRAAADVEVGLEHDALGPALGIGRELLDSATSQQLLVQIVDAEVLQGRHLDHDRVAAPTPRAPGLLGELRHDPLRIGVLAVDLVDGHDDGHFGRLGVVEGLDRLGHDAVVGRHHRARRCR
jgi:hypothetical protein